MAVIHGTSYSHYSVVQLGSADGLLLQSQEPQVAKVCVAAEFVSGVEVAGHWTKGQYDLTVQRETLLLSCSLPRSAGRFNPQKSLTYEAMYGWSGSVITVALGKPVGLQGV